EFRWWTRRRRRATAARADNRSACPACRNRVRERCGCEWGLRCLAWRGLLVGAASIAKRAPSRLVHRSHHEDTKDTKKGKDKKGGYCFYTVVSLTVIRTSRHPALISISPIYIFVFLRATSCPSCLRDEIYVLGRRRWPKTGNDGAGNSLLVFFPDGIALSLRGGRIRHVRLRGLGEREFQSLEFEAVRAVGLPGGVLRNQHAVYVQREDRDPTVVERPDMLAKVIEGTIRSHEQEIHADVAFDRRRIPFIEPLALDGLNRCSQVRDGFQRFHQAPVVRGVHRKQQVDIPGHPWKAVQGHCRATDQDIFDPTRRQCFGEDPNVVLIGCPHRREAG